MLSEERVKEITSQIFSYGRRKQQGRSLADEIEIILIDNNQSLTRYANNVVTQNVHEGNMVELTIRLIKDGKVGRTTTNRTDAPSLKKLVDDAAELCRFQKRDRNLLPLPGKQTYRTTDNYVDKTAVMSPHDRADAIRLVIAECEKHGLMGSGIFSNEFYNMTIANSRGLFAYHRGSSAALTCTALTSDSSGCAREENKDVARISPLSIARTAIDKAIRSQNPAAVPAGRYTVILEPAAVSNFMLFMAWRGFGALSYHEERSFLSGKLGQKILGANITITDNAFHPKTMGVPFDFEGMPKKEVLLIEKGVAKNVVYDRDTARKAKTTSTGHGLPQPNPAGPIPANLVLHSGESSMEELISSTKKGILVTELHYTNLVEPMALVLTGMTRNGTFLVEDGKISRGIKNMRFTESIVKALSQVELITRDSKYSSAFFGGGFVVPALKINDFNFSSETKF